MLLDEAADNEKRNIMADVLMSRTRENDLKETIRQFHHTPSKLRDNAQLAKAEFRKKPSRRSQRFESTSDKPLNQSRQLT